MYTSGKKARFWSSVMPIIMAEMFPRIKLNSTYVMAMHESHTTLHMCVLKAGIRYSS